ncbi:MAG: hypothetical protein FJY67_07750 [Calditrichaeota bacterium]|nr:hypothetical protein [Calditrichota bacterium]
MADKHHKPRHFLPPLHISRTQVALYAIGAVLLILGYLLMSIGPWDNPLSRTVAPLMLLVVYLLVFPAAILWEARRRKLKSDREG